MPVDLSPLRILHVDDDSWTCNIVREFLNAFGIVDIRAVRDGHEAYAELAEFDADIVITGWVMAPIDGYEFAQMLRWAPDSPNPFVPIIMLTSRNTVDQVERARDVGISEYLIKPFTASGLRQKILSIVETPRRFVRAPQYFGPDRRRVDIPKFGAERRLAAI